MLLAPPALSRDASLPSTRIAAAEYACLARFVAHRPTPPERESSLPAGSLRASAAPAQDGVTGDLVQAETAFDGCGARCSSSYPPGWWMCRGRRQRPRLHQSMRSGEIAGTVYPAWACEVRLNPDRMCRTWRLNRLGMPASRNPDRDEPWACLRASSRCRARSIRDSRTTASASNAILKTVVFIAVSSIACRRPLRLIPSCRNPGTATWGGFAIWLRAVRYVAVADSPWSPGRTSPRRAPTLTASLRERTSSLARIAETW